MASLYSKGPTSANAPAGFPVFAFPAQSCLAKPTRSVGRNPVTVVSAASTMGELQNGRKFADAASANVASPCLECSSFCPGLTAAVENRPNVPKQYAAESGMGHRTAHPTWLSFTRHATKIVSFASAQPAPHVPDLPLGL